MAIKDYSTDPDLNVQISGINIAEGCPPSGINNAIRQLMADVKEEKDERDTAQAAKDAAQDEAIAAAKSSAEAAGQAAANAQSSADAAQAKADQALAKESVLPGTVVAWAANSTPNGYLLCNGAAVSRTTYAALFAAIGTIYGAGDGSSTFNLPNLTDKFIQGSGTAGTVKVAGLPDAGGYLTGVKIVSTTVTKTGVFGGTVLYNSDIQNYWNGTRNANAATVDMWLNKSNSIYGASTTVQPPAVTMRYYIKY